MEPDFTVALSFSLAVSVIAIGVLRLIDLNEKEPLWALVVLVWLGVVAAAAAALVIDGETRTETAHGVALTAELAKLGAITLGMIALVVAARRRGWAELNGTIDSLVYGAAAGFGFGIGDAFLRETFASSGEVQTPEQTSLLELLWMTAQTALTEPLFGAILGAGVGYAILGRDRRRWLGPPAGFAAAVGAHLLYIEVALDGVQIGPAASPFGIAIGALVLAVGGTGYVRAFRRETAAIVAGLERELETGAVTRAELTGFSRPAARVRSQVERFMAGDLEGMRFHRRLQNLQVALALEGTGLASSDETDKALVRLRGEIDNERRRSKAVGSAKRRSGRLRPGAGELVMRIGRLAAGVAVLAGGAVVIIAAAGPNRPTTTITKSALFEREQSELRDEGPRPVRALILDLVGPWRLGEVRGSELAEAGAVEAYSIEYSREDAGDVLYTLAKYRTRDDAAQGLDAVAPAPGSDAMGWVNVHLTTLIEGEVDDVAQFCSALPSKPDRRPPHRMAAFERAIDGAVGDSWVNEPDAANPVRLRRRDGRANILGSVEHLDPMTAEQYSDLNLASLSELYAYREISAGPIDLDTAFGAHQRVFEWTSSSGRVRQIQIYVAECDSQFVFTGTAVKSDYDEFEPIFDRAFGSL